MESTVPVPVWARPDAFARAGEGWGWVDRKGRRTSVGSFDELSAAIVDDAGARVDMVWTPQSDYLVLPEEVADLHPALKAARIRWAEWEISEGRRQMMLFGAIFAGIAIYSLASGREMLAFGPLGLAALLFIVLGLIPWYQGRKRLIRARQWVEGSLEIDVPALRFETWLIHEKAPVTRTMLWILVAVGLVQILAPANLMEQVDRGGLTKVDGRPADWWRLATAPMLHGHWIHFLFNAAALAYLGRRMEVLVRWPHVVMVFILAAWVGGEASSRFMPNMPSLGASGGLMGMLGFLLVFEWMHPALVPESSRRRLLAALLLTAAIGIGLFRFIDNGAHGGGLVAGMLYAFAVFPKSSSAKRPNETGTDRIAGSIGLVMIALAAAWTCWVLVR
ncbi:hypothetical protein Hhel01_04228 [Haloferula helveola]